MPFCPECQAEFRQGFDKCNNCGVELVAELPKPMDLSEDAIKKALEGEELIPITRGQLEVVKEVKSMLTSHRVLSLVLDDDNEPEVPGMPKRVMLAVKKDDLDAARAALGESFQGMIEQEGLEQEGGELKFDSCPACGHEVGESEEECPECGLFVGKG